MTQNSKPTSRNLLQQLMDNMTDNIYFKDIDSRFILFNDAFLRWHGLNNTQEVMGKSDFDLFTEEHAREAFEDEKRIMSTGNPVIGKEEKETWEDGHVTWVSTTKLPLKDENGGIIGTFGISRNITENKLNEIKLKQYTKKLCRINEQMEEELRMAANLQSAFLPQHYPSFTNEDGAKLIDFHHHYQADTQIGGDYCSVHQLSETKAGLLVCDVMGHGVRAALVTAIIRTMVEDLAKRAETPGEFFSEMNRQLFPMLRTQDAFIFATACYLIIDIETGTLSGASAGHTTPFLIRPDETSASLINEMQEVAGPALAIAENYNYRTFTTKLNPQDTILMYTDGIYEVCGKDHEEFGLARMAKSLHTHRNMPLKEMTTRLIEDAKEFNAKKKFDDDVCLIGFTLNQLIQPA